MGRPPEPRAIHGRPTPGRSVARPRRTRCHYNADARHKGSNNTMSHILKRDQRRGGRGRFHGRQRWRMRPTFLELEGRALLSTIVVNNPTDTPVAGETDLRQAIALANTNGGAESITFDKTVFNTPQTINLDPALGQLELSDQTGTETITGPRAGVTIKGNYTTAGVTNSVFEIEPGATATLSGLTITGGNNADLRRWRRRLWHGDADRLHRQRKRRRRVLSTILAVRHSPTARSATTPQAITDSAAAAGCGATEQPRSPTARSAATRHPSGAAGWSTMAARPRLPTATSAATPPNTAAGGCQRWLRSEVRSGVRHDHAHQLHDQRQLGQYRAAGWKTSTAR